MLWLWINRKSPENSRQDSLSCSFCPPTSTGRWQQSLMIREHGGLSIFLILGLVQAASLPTPQKVSPAHCSKTLLCSQKSVGPFLLWMSFFDPYLTFIQALGIFLFVKVRIIKCTGQKLGPPCFIALASFHILLTALMVPTSWIPVRLRCDSVESLKQHLAYGTP